MKYDQLTSFLLTDDFDCVAVARLASQSYKPLLGVLLTKSLVNSFEARPCQLIIIWYPVSVLYHSILVGILTVFRMSLGV